MDTLRSMGFLKKVFIRVILEISQQQEDSHY